MSDTTVEEQVELDAHEIAYYAVRGTNDVGDVEEVEEYIKALCERTSETQCLSKLKEKVEKLQAHYFHNTDGKTADIANKTLEDVLQLIKDQTNE